MDLVIWWQRELENKAVKPKWFHAVMNPISHTTFEITPKDRYSVHIYGDFNAQYWDFLPISNCLRFKCSMHSILYILQSTQCIGIKTTWKQNNLWLHGNYCIRLQSTLKLMSIINPWRSLLSFLFNCRHLIFEFKHSVIIFGQGKKKEKMDRTDHLPAM